MSLKKYKKGFICGFFDILHDGHIQILKWAKDNCDELIVAVGTDEFMAQRKHRKPVLTYKQRIEVVSAVRYVDRVVAERDLDKLSAQKEYQFDVMFAGADHEDERIYIEAAKALQELGVDTLFYERSNVSSTELRKRVMQIEA